MKPFVTDNKFLLILDSWGGQTDSAVINNYFTESDGKRSVELEVIPPHCTPFCQPCDVFFFRQVKIIVKKLHNCTQLLQEGRQINKREDAIKINALVHHQLSAPIFRNMLKYAWYKSKLLTGDSPHFHTVNDICFPKAVNLNPCTCKKVAFIKCARCNLQLCFTCFYDCYHPSTCTPAEA